MEPAPCAEGYLDYDGDGACRHRFSIRFDDRFAHGYFDDPERRATLEAAAEIWSNAIEADFPTIPAGETIRVYNPETEQWEEVVLEEDIDDLLIFLFAWDRDDGFKATASPIGYWSSTEDPKYARFKQHPFQPWVARIAVDTDAGRPWFFDQSPDTYDDLPSQSHHDFLSTALHELGHALGMIRLNAPFAFTDLVQNGSFNGAAATALLGRPVPLQPDSGHLLSEFTDGLPRPNLDRHLMHPSAPVQGYRYLPSALELAILEDLGYRTHPARLSPLPYRSMSEDPRRAPYHDAFLEPALPGAPVGLWFLDDPAFLNFAIVGAPPMFMPAADESFESWGIDGAVRVPSGGYLLIEHGLQRSGAGSCANEYSLVFDVRFPELGDWYALYNTSPYVSNDAELYVSPMGTIGQGSYSDRAVQPDRWYRIVVTISGAQGTRAVYVDGERWLLDDTPVVDGRYSLNTGAEGCDGRPFLVLFGDDDDDDAPIDVQRVALFDLPVTEAQAAALGGSSGEVEPLE